MCRREIVTSRADYNLEWLGIPGIERTARGRIYISWFSGGTKEPMPENRVYLQISDDDGETFSSPVMMTNIKEDSRAFDPTLWIDPNGALWLIYNQGNARTGEHGIFARVCDAPDATQPVWSSPRRLGYDVPSFRMNKPTILANGDWLMPVTWSSDISKGEWFNHEVQRQGVGISCDMGKTWELYGEVEAPNWALENMIIQKNDGTVIMYIRAGGGYIWKSLSTDNGRTWSRGETTSIVNPGSRFYIRKLESGRWLLINTPDTEKRKTMQAYLSEDEGETWGQGLMLDDNADVSYPDAVEAEDGVIYSVHDFDRYGAAQVILSIFKESDIF